ncbi:MAG: 3-deoxy-7-phosphoheptulonate synthase class II [Magnetococcales bacterium]|nr:3-deoxy-7-phosphoheptulonate synthase class II [Magnetococcales bacterium]NGZ04876.1 3-deoxy-7-phosphoheptulonate synthase class II [Magnetococcales bacterium]
MNRGNNTVSDWQIHSWKQFPALQQPDWPDSQALTETCNTLSRYPPLVFAGEVRALKAHLAKVAKGEAFLLQGGDCAESFNDFTANSIRDKLKVLLQMAVILTHGISKPVIKVGRIAGQFAKPRSSPFETQNGVSLPSFRGESVNDPAFTEEARQPDPSRLERAYFQSASTLNLLRAFTHGGFAHLSRVHTWNQDFVANSPQGQRYAHMADEITKSLDFMQAIGLNAMNSPVLNEVEYFTSHEALLLEYETALTRQDSLTGDYYDCSAHMIWIGERTRQPDGAHVEFLRGVKNPLGVKIGPKASVDELIRLCDKLNPLNEPGRLTFIGRFGHDQIARAFPALLRAIRSEGREIIWSCDPMHGNTYTAPTGLKTRALDHILKELQQFIAIMQSENVWPGGVHFELTGDNVTECVGGSHDIREEQLTERYETTCDPRLNAAQSLDVAFLVAEALRGVQIR